MTVSVRVVHGLRKVVTGYYQHPAVPGNINQLRTFRQRVNRLWRNVLVRRSQRAKKKWESLTPVFNRGGYPYPESCTPIFTPASTPGAAAPVKPPRMGKVQTY